MQFLPSIRQELPCGEHASDRHPSPALPVGFLFNSGKQEDGKDQDVIIQAHPSRTDFLSWVE